MAQHNCFLCDSDNPFRIFNGNTARFPPRFVGPPQRAHGGIAVASLICPALRAASEAGMASPQLCFVSGRLHAPVPLETDLMPDVDTIQGYAVTISLGDQPIISGKVDLVEAASCSNGMIQSAPEHLASNLKELCVQADAGIDGPTLLEQSNHHYAESGFNNKNNVCFGCSERSYALKLHSRLTASGDIWTRWEVDEEFIVAGGRVATPIVVAALDCSNLWITMAQESRIGLDRQIQDKKMWITGSHAVHLLNIPPSTGDYRILARHLRTEGRKAMSMSALVDRDGTAYAVAEAINILIDVPPEMQLERSA